MISIGLAIRTCVVLRANCAKMNVVVKGVGVIANLVCFKICVVGISTIQSCLLKDVVVFFTFDD